jgi:hypothetical protein
VTNDDTVFQRNISVCGQFCHGESLRAFNGGFNLHYLSYRQTYVI